MHSDRYVHPEFGFFVPNPAVTTRAADGILLGPVRNRNRCSSRRIYAHARPRIPSSLNSGAWKTGPNLPHRLIRQRDARGSPFSSLLSKSVYLLSSPQRTRDDQEPGQSCPHAALEAALHRQRRQVRPGPHDACRSDLGRARLI
jgi:hypothetical protein